MGTKKTFLTFALGIVGVMLLIGAVLMLLVRYMGLKGAEAQTETAAKIVRESLTSHMRGGSAGYQDELLKQLGTIEGIRSAWVVRSEAINRQYGKGIYPQEPKDEIDRAVLREGKAQKEMRGTLFSDTLYRLTIPYIAHENGKIDCMSCHDAKKDEVLGAVSIEIEMNDLKMAGFLSMLGGGILLVLVTLYLLRNVYRFMVPYRSALKEMAIAMEKAEGGDYSHRIDEQENKEAHNAAMWTNSMLEKLHQSLEECDSKIGSLIRVEHPKSNLLYAVQDGINQLYEIDRFRASIERDHNLSEAYERIVGLIRTRWGISDFNIFELNPMTKSTRLIHSEKSLLCDAPNSGCRADRSVGTVDSTHCEEGSCPKMIDPNTQYLCRNFPIGDDMDIVVSFVTYDAREIPKMRSALDQLANYINASRLQIINQKLTDSVRIDSLTGLYNRRYLEELAGLIVAQSKRTMIPYALLMVDMDGFAAINQAYDEQVGHEVIKAMGRNIQEHTRPGDIVIRYGGDTFAVVLYDYEAAGASEVAEAIQTSFKKKIRVNTYAILKTVSIGMAFFPEQTEDMNVAIELSKRALLEAKHKGGNCTLEYDAKTMPM